MSDYPKDVRVVFKMHALPMHQNAEIAARAALAADAQGKFLAMHRKLLANFQKLSRENILLWAKELELDTARFTKDMDAETTGARIKADSKEAEDIGASGTPATFINGRYLSGAKPFAAFKDVIDEEVGWAKAGKRPEFKIGKNVSEAAAPRPAAPPGPDPNKVYDVKAGNAPSLGPPTAKVTLLHYLDYQ